MTTPDPDARILQMLEEYGSDLSARMIVDMHFQVADKAAADQCFDCLTQAGHLVRVYKPGAHHRYNAANGDPPRDWLVECSVNLMPTAANIRERMDEVSSLLAPFGARADGWASYGNNHSKRPRQQGG